MSEATSETTYSPPTHTRDVDIADLARRIDERFPPLTERGRRIALAVHRALSLGDPVPDYGVAAVTGLQISEVREEMAGWPGVYRNESGRIVGFWGLALDETGHRFVVRGKTLYTWCAWDALFLPEILGEEATVYSRCRQTGEDIVLRVGPDGVRDVSGRDVVVSFPDPERCDTEGDRVISTFCCHILFFSSRSDAEQWAADEGSGTFTLTLDEACELGQRCNALRYGTVLSGS